MTTLQRDPTGEIALFLTMRTRFERDELVADIMGQWPGASAEQIERAFLIALQVLREDVAEKMAADMPREPTGNAKPSWRDRLFRRRF